MSHVICHKHVTKIILQHDVSVKSQDICGQGQTSAFTQLQQQSYATLGGREFDSQA